MDKILLLIPCYNESARIDISAFIDFVNAHPQVSLMMVNDGSTDDTQSVIVKMSESHSRIAYYSLSVNQGKGHAIRQAILHTDLSEYDYIGYFDADLSSPLAFYQVLLDLLHSHPEAVLAMASREENNEINIKARWHRKKAGRYVASQINQVTGMHFFDTQCGAKLMRKDAALELFKDSFISAWLFDIELLLRIQQAYKPTSIYQLVIDTPIPQWQHKDGSKITPFYFFKMMKELKEIKAKYKNEK